MHPDGRRRDGNERRSRSPRLVPKSTQEPASSGPGGASEHTGYKVGQNVMYLSKSKQEWIQTTILDIGADGATEILKRKGKPLSQLLVSKYLKPLEVVSTKPDEDEHLDDVGVPSARSSPITAESAEPKAAAKPLAKEEVDDADDDDEEEDLVEAASDSIAKAKLKFNGIGLKKLLAPAQASAEANDPVYKESRGSVPNWPMVLSKTKGKLSEAPYQAGGWPLHIRNPQMPRRQVGKEDLERVAIFLRDTHGFHYASVLSPAPGIAQISLGVGRGSGTIQLYTSSAKLGRPEGNARISIGTDIKAKEIRGVLLKSAWFVDAVAGHSQTLNSVATATFQPDGSLLLPPLSVESPSKDIKSVLKAAFKLLGSQGSKSMRSYLKRCGVGEESMASQVFDEVFPEKEIAPATSPKRRKNRE